MAYEQWYPDETKDEWFAFILAVIVTGIIAGCVFGVRSCARKNKEEKPKVEKAQIINNNAKYNKSTLFVKSLTLNQKIKQA